MTKNLKIAELKFLRADRVDFYAYVGAILSPLSRDNQCWVRGWVAETKLKESDSHKVFKKYKGGWFVKFVFNCTLLYVLSKGESPKTVHSVRERTVRGPKGRE
jgi:hypothetical protein